MFLSSVFYRLKLANVVSIIYFEILYARTYQSINNVLCAGASLYYNSFEKSIGAKTDYKKLWRQYSNECVYVTPLSAINCGRASFRFLRFNFYFQALCLPTEILIFQ
jgi:hypothetical protein